MNNKTFTVYISSGSAGQGRCRGKCVRHPCGFPTRKLEKIHGETRGLPIQEFLDNGLDSACAGNQPARAVQASVAV